MKITVLGCGASGGVPLAGGFWGDCDPNEPRNERTRASLLVQTVATDIVVDATYDLRIHLNRMGLQKVDGLLLSHDHSDHVNGIDDVRGIAHHLHKKIDVYGNAETLDEVHRRSPYLFDDTPDGVYKGFLQRKVIENRGKFEVGDIEIESFEQDHMTCKSLGFRFGDFAYSVDMADLDAQALKALKGVEVWIVDAGAYKQEKVLTHANLARVMAWVDILKPKMTYLTVMSRYMDYKTLCAELPLHVRPAYDGMEIDMSGNRR